MEQEIYKIVVTGPESSGKTSLSMALAAALDCRWVPEFARYYVAWQGRPYVEDDLLLMAAGQRHWEDWYTTRSRKWLVCDTDWTVFQVWHDYRFGPAAFAPVPPYHFGLKTEPLLFQPPDLDTTLKQTHYLLCSPDYPWEPDALRENPDDRAVLFDWYVALLDLLGVSYTVLGGNLERRLKTALVLFGNK